MEEIWKDIRGFEGRYKISSYGNVWQSGKYIDGRQYKSGIKKARLNQFGYPYVTLYYGDKRKTITIHRLVAEHFIPNPNNYKCVDHIDTNKQNNHVKNLRWCNSKFNHFFLINFVRIRRIFMYFIKIIISLSEK